MILSPSHTLTPFSAHVAVLTWKHFFVVVLLCADLQWEEDDGEADHCSDANRHDDSLCVIEACNHAHHVGKAQSEDGLRNTKTPKMLLLMMQVYMVNGWVTGYSWCWTEFLPVRPSSKGACGGSLHSSWGQSERQRRLHRRHSMSMD